MPRPCNVLMVFPRFTEPSFWTMSAICEISGKPWTSPPLGLITVAALLPPSWDVRLIDCNVEPVTDADLAWADLVMTGGMIPQRVDSLAIIARAQAAGCAVVVGGPDVSSSPDVFEAAEFRVIGEAESVMGDFVAAWEAGEPSGRFEAPLHKTDITTSPLPRFDLLKTDKYLSLALQFSRGCPFTCEFCDIIELFGRVPRTKTPEQVLAELDAVYDGGYRGIIFFVDDNLIGNKKAVKAFLPHLARWQQEKGYPFQLYTEASINLADDAELMRLMREANFNLVFIGIETPDSETLVAMRKKQNTRRDLVDSVQSIYRAGMQVHAGFIVGFDEEPETIAQDMITCIEETAIPVCMVGLLTALPNTQLSRRLIKEDRLDPEIDLDFAAMSETLTTADQCTAGLNFQTLRPKRDILMQYRTVLDAIYQPKPFFERVRALATTLDGTSPKVKFEPKRLKTDLRALAGLLHWLFTRHPRLVPLFAKTLLQVAFANPKSVRYAVDLMVFYFDMGPFSRKVIATIDQQIAALDAEPPATGRGDRKPHMPAAETPVPIAAAAE